MTTLTLESNTERFALFAGGFGEFYNAKLLTQNGIEDTPVNRQTIIDLHIKRHQIMDMMRLCAADDYDALASARDELTITEFELQAAWGFPQSIDFHSYWYQVPHCTCPKLDNADNFGTSHKYIAGDCPVHGTNSVDGQAWIDGECVNLSEQKLIA